MVLPAPFGPITPTFPPGELRYIRIARRQIHYIHRHFDLAIEFPEILRVDDVLELGHLIAEFLHLFVIGHLTEKPRDFIEPIEDLSLRCNGLFDIPLHVLLGIELGLLGQVTYGKAIG